MDKKKAHTGYFITFEGGEGSGKSSQINLLSDHLIQQNYQIQLTREPGGTAGAEIVRHVVLSGNAEKLGPDFETMLFAAARGDHVDQVIRPALKAGNIVLCDRFIDSTRVYQGAGSKVDMAFIHQLEQVTCGDVWPDLTLILDLPPEEGMRRANARRDKNDKPDRFEKEAMAQQALRRDAFRKIAQEEPERCKLIDASGSKKQVADRIWKIVKPALKNRL